MLTVQGGDSLVGGLPIIHITYQQYIANPSAYHDPDVIVHISGFPTAGNMPADYVGYDENLNMEDIGNIATKAIAKVEPSNTALYLHPVGSYFINKDGNACKTDVQISVGGTITLGTNCHVVDGVANDINSNVSFNLTFAGGYVAQNERCVCIGGRLIEIYFELSFSSTTQTSFNPMFTVPSQYKPPKGACITVMDTTNDKLMCGTIGSDGKSYIYRDYSTGCTSLRIHGMYTLD